MAACARIAQHGVVLGGQEQERDAELAEVSRVLPLQRGLDRGKQSLAVGHEVRHQAVAEGLFQDAAVGVVDRGVGGLFKESRGGRVVAVEHCQPAQLEQSDARHGVVELAGGQHRPLQIRGCLRLSSAGQQGQAAFQIGPRLRPVVRRADGAGRGIAQVGGQGIVFRDGAQQRRPTPQGQGGAAHDLLRRDGIKIGLLHDAAPLLRQVAKFNLPLQDAYAQWIEAQLGLTGGGAPGDDLPRARGGDADRRRELHLRHPVGKSLEQFQGVGVVLQRFVEDAHLKIALAAHRLVTDRVDPPRLRRLDRTAGFRLKCPQRVGIVSVVEGAEIAVIAGRGRLSLLGRRRPNCRAAQQCCRHRDRQKRSDHALCSFVPRNGQFRHHLDLTFSPPSFPGSGDLVTAQPRLFMAAY